MIHGLGLRPSSSQAKNGEKYSEDNEDDIKQYTRFTGRLRCLEWKTLP